MKLILLMLFFLISCTSIKNNPDQPHTNPIPKFLSHVEIRLLFNIGEQRSARSEQLSQAAERRKIQSLIPHEKFFEQTAYKKKTKTEYKAKGFADLREYDSPIEDQWNGTCTAHSLRSVIDNKARTQVSTRHIWSEYQKYSCKAAIDTWLSSDRAHCITDNFAWAHGFTSPNTGYKNREHCHTFLTNVTYIDSDINLMKQALDNGNPVYLGITVTNSLLNCDKVLLPYSKPSGGGHALAIVGYKDDDKIKGGGYFIVKNSWGTDCGDQGYQYIPFYHCLRKDMYCIAWSIDEVKTTI